MLDKAFGERLQYLRKSAKINEKYTQIDAAKDIGVGYKSLQNHESGMIPNPNNLQKYLDTYKCNRTWLVTGEGEPFPDKGKEDLPFVSEEKAVYGVGEKPWDATDPLIQAIAGMKKMFNSEDAVLFQTLSVNIAIFEMAAKSVLKILEQEKKIVSLQRQLQNLTDQIQDLRSNMTPAEPAAVAVATGSKET